MKRKRMFTFESPNPPPPHPSSFSDVKSQKQCFGRMTEILMMIVMVVMIIMMIMMVMLMIMMTKMTKNLAIIMNFEWKIAIFGTITW